MKGVFMAEEHTQQPSSRGKSRRERVEYARSRDILDVANELNIELVQSGRDYRWKEHDSMVVSTKKNMWNWFSRHQGGDVIALVQTIKEVDFNQAIDFLNDGTFKEFTKVEHVQEPFSYYLAPYEQPFEAARSYLKDQRGLSDETIGFFFEKGVLAQANAKVNGSIEPVVVFKSLDFSGEIVGATLQGIEENWEKWPERGYAKNIVRNSDGIIGMHVDIGQPNRLIFAESAIDLMSYYELHRDHLQDVRLISMDGLKEVVVGRHVAQLQSEVSGRPLTWSHDQLAEGLQTAIDNGFFADGKHADWITLAVDNDEGGRNFIASLREKGATVTEDLPLLKEGQVKTDWNDALKQPPIDNSRLGQARRKLDRLNQEFSDATEAVYGHAAQTNGQPMNDKRGGARFFKRQEQLENRVFDKLDEIKKQEERVERLEQQAEFKEQGLNRQGTGLEMSVQNIPRIREELEKAERGESMYTKATLKRYREELTRLEKISEQLAMTTIQPSAQALIEAGNVTQWEKRPNLYFVKGLRRVALELGEDGKFRESARYRPRTAEEQERVNELLEQQGKNEGEPQISTVEAEHKEGSIHGQTNEGQGLLFENLVDVIPASNHATVPELQVVFDFSENPKLSNLYSSEEVIPYNDFIAKLYEENEWQSISPDLGYYKTYFALQDESRNPLTPKIRFDIGSETEDLSEQLSQDLPSPYLELAQKADHDYHAKVSYDTFKANQKGLSEAVQSQIQAGVLQVTLSDDAYFYTLVNYTGWSHPLQQLKPKALEGLKEYRAFFESINDTNIERFKEKGTPEQNRMYDILKKLQKDLGRSNTSTVFSEEIAISAYNLNRKLESLTAENWASSIVDPLGSLGRDVWNIINYPANDIVTGATDYYFQIVPYHLLEYLNGKTGIVEISLETYNHILQQLRDEEIIIAPETPEDVAQVEHGKKSTAEETVHEAPALSSGGSEVSPEDQKWLKENWENIRFTVQLPKTITGKDESSFQDPERQPNLQIVFQSSGEQVILDKYEPGEIVPYDIFVKDLYSENRKRLEEATELPTFPVLHLPGDESGTWFGLLDENGNTLIERFRYDIGVENETISERLERSIPSEYLEIAQQIDALFPKISLPEVVLEEPGIPVTIYSEHQKIGTIDLDDLFNKGDLGSISDELGYGWAVNPSRMLAVINDETLNQVQVDNLIERMIENGISGVDLKQYLDNPEFSLKSYAETGDIGLQEKEKAQEGQSEQNKKERTNVSKGSLQPEAEGSAIPVPSDGTFEPAVTSHPTLSSRYLKFTIDNGYVSNVRDGYHVISQRELDKLNNFAPSIQEMANWYRDNLASSDILYVVQNGAETDIVRLTFEEKNFSHLTGIQPVEKNHSAAKTLHDFAEGIGHYNNILLANQNNTFKKLGVLPNLKAVLNPVSFYFDDLEEIKRFRRMDVSRAIKSDDEDILLAFRTVDGTSYPATLLKVKGGVKADIDSVEGKTILGIYRERAGQIEQIAVNEELVKDSGKAMFEVLKNQEYEEPDQEIAIEEAQQIVDIDSDGDGYTDEEEIALGTDPFDGRDHPGKAREVSPEQFTQVLDAVYNVGAPESLERIPEELHAAWTRYFSYAEEHGDDLGKIIAAADGDQLLDKTSNLYQEWHQDQIYQNDYHVRLQWAEEWPEGPQIPFKETELVAYQTFIETLYEQNQAFYKRHQDSMAIVNETGNQEAYIPFTKVKFDIYAPGGTLIKSDVRYNIGDETEPISRLLGLGYRRLEGQPQLAAIDKQVLSQLENQEVNQEISTEANEQSLKATEIIPDESGHSRGNFHSPNEAMKVGLTQRVEEIMAEEAAKILVSSIPQIQESLSFEGNLIGTSQLDGRMLYINREDFGQDYHLELAVHSPMMIEQLSDTQAPWTLALIKGDEPLGYVAYGSDWGNDFQIAEELEKFAEQIGSERVPEGLYKQEEVDTFLATSQTNENTQKESKPATSDEPFDYSSATAYEISEHAFQKIREYTKSPEDMLEYMDFMSKFPQLSPRNVALIHDQWRGANVVATYDQWQAMGDVLGIKPEDVIQTKAVYTNKRTGETKEVLHQGLSVKTGEKSQITLFRPLMVKMIPVLDENGRQVKNDKGNPKYKKFSEASAQEKALVKEGKIPVRQFQERDPKTGQARFTTYKVFELSQTTLKPESYPKAMPNRHYNFNVDKVKTKEVLEGLCDYAESIGVKMMKDEARVLGNAKGAFFPGEQLILINPDNTPGEKIATTIHELAHATLHNPKLAEQYKENLPKGQKELEAEMTSHLLSKHFGLDTSEKAIDYIASWTKNLTVLDDKQLADSLKRIHKTVSTMLKQVETRTKPYQVGKMRGQAPNFPKAQVKGPSR